jgi:hypothetical protein
MHLFKAITSTWAVGQSWSIYSLSIGCFGSSHVKLKLVTIMLPIFASPLTLSRSLSFSCPERVYAPLPAWLWQALSVKYSTVPPSPKTCTMAGAKRRIKKRGLISYAIMKSRRHKLGLKEDGWRSLLSKRASDALLYQRGAAALCYSLLIASWELHM